MSDLALFLSITIYFILDGFCNFIILQFFPYQIKSFYYYYCIFFLPCKILLEWFFYDYFILQQLISWVFIFLVESGSRI